MPIAIGINTNDITEVQNNSTNYVYFNYSGYLGANTQFRNLFVGDGKQSANPILYTEGSSGYVGVGTSSPNRVGLSGISTTGPVLHIFDSSGTGTSRPVLNLESNGKSALQLKTGSSSSGSNPEFWSLRSRGTAASPTVVAADDSLFSILAYAYDGTNYDSSAASMTMKVDGTPGTSDMPGRIEFATTSDGASSPTTRMTIKNDGKIGIGIAAPRNLIEVAGTNDQDGVTVKVASDNATGDPILGMYRARGSLGAYTAAASADEGGSFNFTGYDGTNNWAAAYIMTKFDATTGTNDMPTRLYFGTNPDGSTTTAIRLTIKNTGNIGIGNQSPSRLLHVGSASTTTGTAVANFQNADGTCTITPAAAGTGIACSSDERLKENFQNISGEFALERILKLQAVSYNFKTASIKNRRTGYKAQNVQSTAPEFVRKDDNGYLQVYYDAFIPWITEAIKSISSRLQLLQDQQLIQNRQIASKVDQSQIEILKNENLATLKQIQNLESEYNEIETRLDAIESTLNLPRIKSR